jgi:hypothetical protein
MGFMVGFVQGDFNLGRGNKLPPKDPEPRRDEPPKKPNENLWFERSALIVGVFILITLIANGLKDAPKITADPTPATFYLQ